MPYEQTGLTRAYKTIEKAIKNHRDELDLHSVREVRKAFPEILKIKSLRKLDLSRCYELEEDEPNPKFRFESLLELRDLEELNLQGNWPSQTFLERLSELPKLKLLRLPYIKEFPEGLTKAPALEVLTCDYCDIHSIPESFRKLKTLHTLSLQEYGGDLRELFSILSDLPNLHKLRIFSYESQIPENIQGLSQLEELDLFQWVNLEKLPDCISKLSHLRALDLGVGAVSYGHGEWEAPNPKLTELPDSLVDLVNLEFISLYGQTNIHKLPKGFENLKKLKKIKIGGSGVCDWNLYSKAHQEILNTFYWEIFTLP